MRFKKMYVEITNVCNKSCEFCSKDKRVKKEMSLIEFEHVVNDIKSYTDYIYLHVKGEPLSHRNFKEILDICKQNDLRVNITTNGTFLFKQVNTIINSNVVRQVNISFNSVTNNEIESIIEAIKILIQNNIYVVCRFWALDNNKLSTLDLNKIKLILEKLDKKDLLDNVIKDNNIKITNNLFINKHLLFVWPNDSKKICDKGSCYGLKTHIGILSDGTVVPCCLDSDGNINLGNIFNESLADILNKERTKKIIEGFKNNVLVEELCKHCDIIAIKNNKKML